jgi:ABC-2 type transport system ATP-binding protein
MVITDTLVPPAADDPPQLGLTLEVEHVTKRYGGRTVVDDVSFTVQPGRVTGFLGPNGSGKSTTMKILLDLAAADGGQASIGGVRYRDLAEPARTVGVVLEPNAFHPGRSARNHLEILADFAGISAARVDEVLELVGLEEAGHRRAGAFSLGMKQRLSLAGALLGDPPVLVLDEPGNGLDPQGILALRQLLRARADSGHTVFLSSHLLGEVEHLADEVVVLNAGRLVTSGPLQLLRTGATRVRSADPDRLAAALRSSGATVDGPDAGLLLVRGPSMEVIGDVALRAEVALHELAADTSSLEDLFLDWTRAGSPSLDGRAEMEEAENEERVR